MMQCTLASDITDGPGLEGGLLHWAQKSKRHQILHPRAGHEYSDNKEIEDKTMDVGAGQQI
jgi:hypothetical protein